MSEVPVGYTVSVESSFDPSHAQYLHEGIGYFSPKTAVPIEHFDVLGEMSAEAGFTLKHTGYNLLNKDMEAMRQFTPGGSPLWKGGVEESAKDLNNEQLYDRWHRHTKHCPSCRDSVMIIEKVRIFFTICTGSFALLSLVLLLIGTPLKLALTSTIIGVLCSLLSYMADDLRQRFISSIPKRGLPLVEVYGSNAK
jgi:hypothetical protein